MRGFLVGIGPHYLSCAVAQFAQDLSPGILCYKIQSNLVTTNDVKYLNRKIVLIYAKSVKSL